MAHLNIEIKARCADAAPIAALLRQRNARFVGVDHQIDTYFNVPNGRLKLREGNIENALIHYERTDQEGPKRSDVTLLTVEKGSLIKEILTKSVGVKTVVDKRRQIFFIENVKFHLDDVASLGSFVEIEAIDTEGLRTADELQKQCAFYMQLFKIAKKDLLTNSYSDMTDKSIADGTH